MMNGKMSTRVMKEICIARGETSIRETEIRKLRELAKQTMWDHYSANRSGYSDDIGNFREEIIVELMKGNEVGEVFDFYGWREALKAG